MRWKMELRKRIKSAAGLENFFPLYEEEKLWFQKTGGAVSNSIVSNNAVSNASSNNVASNNAPSNAAVSKNETSSREAPPFAFQVTPYFLSLAGKKIDDPIRRQCVPLERELHCRRGETADPLDDQARMKAPRLVHRYRDRALLLVTDECAVNCRYCFRRYYSGGGRGPIRGNELKAACSYLKARREIRELILSGGDPLTLDDNRLFEIIDILREARPGLILRLSTRIPSVLPSRVTRCLARGLALRQPLWGVLHINHAQELSADCRAAIRRLVSAGIPLVSQTVLLAGINSDEAVLEELFRSLIARGVKPYYLFQADLAEGTGGFRVPIRRGQQIMKALRSRLSALALPEYAVDLPVGGGKVPLTPSYETDEDADSVFFENIEGKRGAYPKI
ncbi:MAG: KamA family radical SAM protein [Spirochaetales bacterium]|jgi:lysine 2,3-aminomutase|nr:KamA family radical SAM protein [Spirochaetales bacterium]